MQTWEEIRLHQNLIRTYKTLGKNSKVTVNLRTAESEKNRNCQKNIKGTKRTNHGIRIGKKIEHSLEIIVDQKNKAIAHETTSYREVRNSREKSSGAKSSNRRQNRRKGAK